MIGDVPLSDLFGRSGGLAKCAHFCSDGGPLSGSVLMDEVENDFVFLHGDGST
jgi:hypothetical protein